MIIECVKCRKKFNVNSELIPNDGRTIQCGSCNHIWFFNKNDQNDEKSEKTQITKEKKPVSKNVKIKKDVSNSDKSSELIKYQPKSNFTFSNFLSYILVIIISFFALIIILDTFKDKFYVLFPNLEVLLFSLFETIEDIKLFIKDLFQI
tara:strand:+ start:3047 stop:3493 length:447 start_codon:yes stop_codon:yes gene_type:complete